jgi:hypothetical protein
MEKNLKSKSNNFNLKINFSRCKIGEIIKATWQRPMYRTNYRWNLVLVANGDEVKFADLPAGETKGEAEIYLNKVYS